VRLRIDAARSVPEQALKHGAAAKIEHGRCHDPVAPCRPPHLGDGSVTVGNEIEHELRCRAGECRVGIGQRGGIAVLKDHRLAKLTRARKGEKRFREIDADDAPLRPARRHRTRQAAGAAAHVEQRAVIGECCKVKELLRQPARATTEEHLVSGAIGCLVHVCA
jgi:hypothetical protein